MAQQQGPSMLAAQMNGMSLAPQATPEVPPLQSKLTPQRAAKPRHRYANDPSLAPAAGEMNPPSYSNANPAHMPGAPTSGPSALPSPPVVGAPAKPRIDPNQAPSVVDVHAQDQREFALEPFYTMARSTVPRANTDFYGVDNGESPPRPL